MAITTQDAFEVASIALGEHDIFPEDLDTWKTNRFIKATEWYLVMRKNAGIAVDALSKFSGLFEGVVGHRIPATQTWVESVWGYVAGQGYGIWPLELEWEDIAHLLSDTRSSASKTQTLLDEFTDRLIENPRALERLEKIQAEYIDALRTYRSTSEEVKESFVKEWNALTEESQDDSLLGLPASITVEDFDEWFEEKSGVFYPIHRMAGVLARWISANGGMVSPGGAYQSISSIKP